MTVVRVYTVVSKNPLFKLEALLKEFPSTYTGFCLHGFLIQLYNQSKRSLNFHEITLLFASGKNIQGNLDTAQQIGNTSPRQLISAHARANADVILCWRLSHSRRSWGFVGNQKMLVQHWLGERGSGEMLTLSIALGSFGARMSHTSCIYASRSLTIIALAPPTNALALKRPRIQDAQMETTYRVLTREVLEWHARLKDDVARLKDDVTYSGFPQTTSQSCSLASLARQ